MILSTPRSIEQSSIRRKVANAFVLFSVLATWVIEPQRSATAYENPPAPQSAVRPNVLFIIADDLGWADVGYHGSEIDTPNIDRLAREGRRLEQHYVTPMCSSTRACLLSGRFSTRFGLDGATNARVFDVGMTTLASALRKAGYETCLAGKWHLGSKLEWGPRHFGFDRSYGPLAGGIDQYLHLYKRGPYRQTWHRDDRFIEEEGHSTDLIAREAVRLIEAKRDRPFYIQIAFTAVHIPIQEPKEWIEPYVGRIENESRRRFAACVTHMDDAIGRIVNSLEATGQRQNTLIVFTSDNGGSGPWKPAVDSYPGKYEDSPVLGNNRPLRGMKGTVYEGGIRVPALANWPGVLHPGQVDVPLHIVDWMPTLIELAGFKPDTPPQFDGTNIWPALQETSTDISARTFYFKRGSASALRHGDWKLIETTDRAADTRLELFDLANDPYEKNNLAEANPDQVADLAAMLRRQRAIDGNPPTLNLNP